MKDMIGGTIEQELLRRDECRYGLHNIKVQVDGRVRYTDGCEWDDNGKLKVFLIDAPRVHTGEIKDYTLEELMAAEFPEPEFAMASDVTLLEVWPVVCCRRRRKRATA